MSTYKEVTKSEAETGAETAFRAWSPLRVRQAATTAAQNFDHPITASFTKGELSLGGVQDPGEILVGIVSLYEFDDGATREVFISLPLPGVYKDGSDITLNYDWVPEDGTAGSVTWGAESRIVRPNNGELITGATATATVSDAAAGTAEELQSAPDLTISGTGATSGDVVHLRIFRDGAAGADTYGAKARLDTVVIATTADSI